jgi:predicted nucleic acid-binding protein
MKLVVDTNILFSFFRDTIVRKIIVNSKNLGLELFTPKYAFEEIIANKSKIMKYAGITSEEYFEFVISTLQYFVRTVPSEFFEDLKEEAKRISPDLKDSPFFALALKLSCGIWSNEKRLKRQSRVSVFSTREMVRLLFKSKS